MGSGWSGLKLGEPYDSEWEEFRKDHCAGGEQDLSSPLYCWEDNQTIKNYPDWLMSTLVSMNTILRFSYYATRENILDLICPDITDEAERERRFDKIWPVFHKPYNSHQGKKEVDEILASLDFPISEYAKQVIKLNWQDDKQRKYCIMNGARHNEAGDFTWRSDGGVDPSPWGRPLFAQKKIPRWEGEKRTTKEDNNYANDYEEISKFAGFRFRPGQPGVRKKHLVDPGMIGNPVWSNERRKREKARVLPPGFNELWNEVYVTTSRIDPDCTWEDCWEPKFEAGFKGVHFDHPIYGGMEPSIATPFHPYNIPGINDQLSGGAGSSWSNPCDSRGMLETLLPVAAAAVGAVVPMVFLPRGIGTYILSATASGALYYVAQDFYGIDALLSLGDKSNTKAAATILTLGAPTGGILLLADIGFFSSVGYDISLSTAGIIGVAAAGVAYVTSKDSMALSLEVGTGIGSIITSPLALIETGVTLLTNGCVAQEFLAPYKCTCQEASETGGKTSIRNSLINKIFGATGQQKELRLACLEKEMRRGGWASTGSDTDVISQCTGVVMENPFACWTAQNWVSKEPFFPGEKRTDEQEKDMWNQIWHCLDRQNPSFYPPNDAADVECQKHGEQFRYNTTTKSCKNYALPGPNNTDPIGLQDPGVYDGSGDSWCTIL